MISKSRSEGRRRGRGKKYISLLQNKNIERWYNNVARGSVITADVYLRRLGSFCKDYNVTPEKLIKMKEKTIGNLLLDAVSDLEEKKSAGSYIASIIKAVKSWLAFNDIIVKRKIKIKGAADTPSLADESVPTQAELKQIFLHADTRGRTACALLAHAGLRNQVLGNYKGDDGLRIKDFPELSIEGKEILFKKTPAMVIVRKELSKSRKKYFTFLSEEGCEYLIDYLNERRRNGEKLTENSSIIPPKRALKPFICSMNIGNIIRKPLSGAGIEARPYVLRPYFDTMLMVAESKHLMIKDYRTFFMGHTGDIENRYTTNKGRLPNQVIEDMREAYRKSQKFLQTTIPETDVVTKSDAKARDLELVKNLAKNMGVHPDVLQVIDNARLSYLNDEEKMDFLMKEIGKLYKGKIEEISPEEKRIEEFLISRKLTPELRADYEKKGWDVEELDEESFIISRARQKTEEKQEKKKEVKV